MSRALRVEWLKFRRSPVVIVATALMVVLLPAMGLGMFSVASADTTGPISAKVQGLLIGEGWHAYLGVIAQTAAAAVFVGAGVVAAWVFGREHADRTFPSLFALPVPRSSIASAKFAILTGWVTGLTVAIGSIAVMVGILASVGTLDSAEIVAPTLRLVFVVAATGLLAMTAALVASVGRGYLPAIGAIIVIVAVAQISVLFGAGGWFPFSLPGLAAIAGSEAAPTLSAVQIALVPALVLVVIWLTVRWWDRAEVV